MRDYGKVSPQFWIGKTGKALRGHPSAQVVALYLMTSPHSTMLGVYHLPRMYLAHETGLPPQDASAGLDKCIELGFCVYDDESETVFVVEMAAHQVGESLSESDNRAKGIDRQYRSITCRAIAEAFFSRYGESFHLSPLQAPSEGLQKGLPKPLISVPVLSPAPAPALAREDDLFPGVDPQVVADFRALRKAKKAAITATAVAGIKREAEKAGLTLESALRICCERGWAGFKAEWMRRDGAAPPAPNVPGGGRRAL